MRVPWRVRFLVELVETPAIPQAALDDEARPVMVNRDRIGRVSLQLDRIRPGLLRRLHDGQGPVEPAEVVGRK